MTVVNFKSESGMWFFSLSASPGFFSASPFLPGLFPPPFFFSTASPGSRAQLSKHYARVRFSSLVQCYPSASLWVEPFPPAPTFLRELWCYNPNPPTPPATHPPPPPPPNTHTQKTPRFIRLPLFLTCPSKYHLNRWGVVAAVLVLRHPPFFVGSTYFGFSAVIFGLSLTPFLFFNLWN